MAQHPALRPAESAEDQILVGILNGRYQAGTSLPSERELAVELKVTRPTLREVLQRLARDGWLEIHHGKPTIVRNYLEDGNLTILSTLAERVDTFPADMVPQILQTRLLLAPAYTRLAITKAPGEVEGLLKSISEGSDDPDMLAKLDFQMQKILARLSGNSILLAFVNNLEVLLIKTMKLFYQNEEARKQARVYFRMIYKAARAGEPDAAEAVTRRVMRDYVQLWENSQTQGG
jgi:GntR family transcriptional regulator, negative regulator for fad regulon and positive regulator of fabA